MMKSFHFLFFASWYIPVAFSKINFLVEFHGELLTSVERIATVFQDILAAVVGTMLSVSARFWVTSVSVDVSSKYLPWQRRFEGSLYLVYWCFNFNCNWLCYVSSTPCKSMLRRLWINLNNWLMKSQKRLLNETKYWGDQDVDGRIILRWIFMKWEGVVGTGWSWLRIGTGGGRLWVW